MAHIHAEDGQHDLTVSLFIIRTGADEPRVLLHVHRKLAKLLPIGGHVELNETPWQAVAHELKEESGYDLSQLQVLQPPERITSLTKAVVHPQPMSVNTHDFSSTHFHTDLQFAFVTNEMPNGTPEEGETNDLRWLTRSELAALTDKDIFENTKELYGYALSTLLQTWEPIPTTDFLLTYPKEYFG